MKVDHLAADVDRTGLGRLGDVQAKPTIEGQHRVGVQHRHGHVIQPLDALGLGQRPRIGQAGRDSGGHRALDEHSPGKLRIAQNCMSGHGFYATGVEKKWQLDEKTSDSVRIRLRAVSLTHTLCATCA